MRLAQEPAGSREGFDASRRTCLVRNSPISFPRPRAFSKRTPGPGLFRPVEGRAFPNAGKRILPVRPLLAACALRSRRCAHDPKAHGATQQEGVCDRARSALLCSETFLQEDRVGTAVRADAPVAKVAPPATAAGSRYPFVDLLRGLIIAFMGLDTRPTTSMPPGSRRPTTTSCSNRAASSCFAS